MLATVLTLFTLLLIHVDAKLYGFVNASNDERELFKRIGDVVGTPQNLQQAWQLVRHTPSNKWHPSTDQLRGKDVYGVPGDRAASHAWSVAWDLKDVTEFLFASVNLAIEPPAQHWLNVMRNDIVGEDGNRYYANQPIKIVASTVSSKPYTAKWYRRNGAREDPWVSMGNHPDGMVYGGRYDSDPDAHGDLLRDGGGMNVYIKTKDATSPLPQNRKLLELTWRDLADKVTLRYFPPGRDYSGPPLTAWNNGVDIPCTVDPTSLQATVHPPSSFRDDIPLKLFTHGFDDRTKSDSSKTSEYYQFIKAWQDYHKYGEFGNGTDVGVILLNWSFWARGPKTRYDTAARNSIDVGHFTGRCLAALVRWTRLQSKDIHLVGHSLGAQLVGKAGRTMGWEKVGLPGRITGLDPAGPRFFEGPNNRKPDPDLAPERLNRGSANFVDVIHTNSGFKPAALKFDATAHELSAVYQQGDRDFYAEGGRRQPGCKTLFWNGCNHSRAVDYYLHSLRNPFLFRSQRCNSVENCTKMKASHPAANILMGEPAEHGLSAWTFGDEPEMFITDIMYCHWTKRNKDKRC